MKRWAIAIAAASLALAAAAAGAQPAKLSIVVFNPPSLGAFLPPVIKAQKFDAQNGLDLTFVERTPDAYSTQFNSGEFQVGGSAALLSIGIARNRGVAATYLFNLFDFWGAVVTSSAEVQGVKDLAGKQLAAARGTTNFAMFDWFARRQGLDIGKVAVVNTATPGLIGYAIAERADAVQLWEPAYTQLLVKKPSVRALDLDIKRQWRQFAGTDVIPYLGVAAHEEWIAKNRRLIEPLFRTYKSAADWVRKHPADAADVILPKGSAADRLAIRQLIEHNDRLGMNVVMAGAIRKEIESVFSAGESIKYLDKPPGAAAVYSGGGK